MRLYVDNTFLKKSFTGNFSSFLMWLPAQSHTYRWFMLQNQKWAWRALNMIGIIINEYFHKIINKLIQYFFICEKKKKKDCVVHLKQNYLSSNPFLYFYLEGQCDYVCDCIKYLGIYSLIITWVGEKAKKVKSRKEGKHYQSSWSGI